MFDSMGSTRIRAEDLQAAWDGDEPRPGEPGYESFLAYEAQQIAFWSAYGASDRTPEDVLPNLNGTRTDEGLLGEIARQVRRANAAEGAKLRAIADYANRQIANPAVGYSEEYMRRSVEAEVGCTLKVPPSTASSIVHLALTLSRRLPKTFAAIEDGTLTKPAAELIADESENLNGAQCAQLEDSVLADAGQRSYRSLRHHVRRQVEKLDAEAVRKRAERAREERCLYVRDGHDGMATLCLQVPAAVARAIYDAINDKVLGDQAALKAKAAEASLVLAARDDRPVGAQRADAAVDLLADALGVDLWAPAAPAGSSFLTEAQIVALDKNGDSYVPSEAMKAAIRNRDQHCRFPGCRRPARHCDLDHTIPFVKVGGKVVGGRTVYDKPRVRLCRFHHQIKAMPGWHLEQERGRFIWTTPQGLRFITYPPPDDDGAEPPDFGPPEDLAGFPSRRSVRLRPTRRADACAARRA